MYASSFGAGEIRYRRSAVYTPGVGKAWRIQDSAGRLPETGSEHPREHREANFALWVTSPLVGEVDARSAAGEGRRRRRLLRGRSASPQPIPIKREGLKSVAAGIRTEHSTNARPRALR